MTTTTIDNKTFRIGSLKTKLEILKAANGTVLAEGTLLSLDSADGKYEVWADKSLKPTRILNRSFTMDSTGESKEDLIYSGIVRADMLVYPATFSISSIPSFGGSAASSVAVIPVADLAAGADIATVNSFISMLASEIEEIGIMTKGTPAGIDDSNTAVIAVADLAANVIVSKTYDTANQPPDEAYESLGALDATHKVLTAGEIVTLAVTQGAAANLPAFDVIIKYKNTLSEQTVFQMLHNAGIEAITTLENRH